MLNKVFYWVFASAIAAKIPENLQLWADIVRDYQFLRQFLC
ncbi:MAG: hypothetical protein AB4290_06265 [Spirulina sp.]